MLIKLLVQLHSAANISTFFPSQHFRLCSAFTFTYPTFWSTHSQEILQHNWQQFSLHQSLQASSSVHATCWHVCCCCWDSSSQTRSQSLIIIPYTVYIVLFPDLHKLLYIKVIYKGSLKGPHDFPVQACHMNINMQLNTIFPQPAGIAHWLEWQGSVDSSMVRVPDS